MKSKNVAFEFLFTNYINSVLKLFFVKTSIGNDQV
jgi:hypothetical protein